MRPQHARQHPFFTATEAEFRYRFWILAVLFFGSFQLYWWDKVPAARALAHLLARSPGSEAAMQSLVYGTGALAVTLAAALRTWASAYLDSSVVHDERVRDHRLVAEGPYRYVRNPLYLGTVLVAIGIGVAASRSGCAVLVAGVTLFQYRLTRREEAALAATQGAGYCSYLQAVPRLLPSLRPRLPAGAARPQWAQALLGELFMWAYAASCVAFAVSGSTHVLMYGCIAATALVPLTSRMSARHAQARQLAQ